VHRFNVFLHIALDYVSKFSNSHDIHEGQTRLLKVSNTPMVFLLWLLCVFCAFCEKKKLFCGFSVPSVLSMRKKTLLCLLCALCAFCEKNIPFIFSLPFHTFSF